jgi:choice-of-anchor C domain-containing protein
MRPWQRFDRASSKELAMARNLATCALAAVVFFSFPRAEAPGRIIEVPLLINGSFERGPAVPDPDPKGFKELDANSRELPGWVVTRGQIDWITTYWDHADGKRSLDLHGSPGIGGIKQTFATRKGQTYRVTFYLAGNPLAEVKHVEKAVVVMAANDDAKFTFDASNRTVKDMGWQLQTWDFIADAKETTLEFVSPMTESAAAGPAIDNVRVVPVP